MYLQRKDHQLSANDLVACTKKKKIKIQKHRNGTDFLILQRETLLWNNVLSLQILYDKLLTWLLQISKCSERLLYIFSKAIWCIYPLHSFSHVNILPIVVLLHLPVMLW